MNDALAVTLPQGYWLDGVCHREASLRPLTGEDETFLMEAGESLWPVQRTTALLARCLTRLGTVGEVTTVVTRSLTVGDREAMLLHLRRLVLGERLQCVLTCPSLNCLEKLDLDLKVSDFLLPPYPHSQERYETTVPDSGVGYRVRFRLPTGADQEAAAPLCLDDPEAAASLVLQRCIEKVTVEAGETPPVNGIPLAVAQALPQVMADLDPQAEVRLNLTCPACGIAFSVLFDPADYFCRELSGRRTDLYREVHLLAFYYHWSEAEIMALTARKRQRYLNLLAEELGQGKSR